MANDLLESKIARCKDAGLAGAFLTFSDLVVLHQELTRLRAMQAEGGEVPDGWHLEVRPYFDTSAVFAVNENGAAIWIAAAPSPKVEASV